MVKHRCVDNRQKFCFICTEYVKGNNQKKCRFTPGKQEMFKQAFGIDEIQNLDQDFAGALVCPSCNSGLISSSKSNKQFRFKCPAVWNEPNNRHTDCFVCTTGFNDGQRKFNGLAYKSVIMPVMSHTHPLSVKAIQKRSSTGSAKKQTVKPKKQTKAVKSGATRGRPRKTAVANEEMDHEDDDMSE